VQAKISKIVEKILNAQVAVLSAPRELTRELKGFP